MKVVQITEHARHGARTGRDFFPDSDNAAEVKLGQRTLTGNGMRQHYLIGLELRRRYPDILGTKSSPIQADDIEAFTSGSERTVESAVSQLMAIF